MIKVRPRLAILGNSSNMVSSTLRYLCFILNKLQKTKIQEVKGKLILQKIKRSNAPEQLKCSKYHNKIERLHVKGESNQAQESKDGHREVKPVQMSNVYFIKTLHGQLGNILYLITDYLQIPSIAEISHWPQTCYFQEHLNTIN